METNRNQFVWDIISKSVRGASHIRTGLPNQDFIRYHKIDNSSVIFVLADGHGSKRSFRSEYTYSLTC